MCWAGSESAELYNTIASNELVPRAETRGPKLYYYHSAKILPESQNVDSAEKTNTVCANLVNFRVLLKSLGGYVALDKIDVSRKTSA